MFQPHILSFSSKHSLPPYLSSLAHNYTFHFPHIFLSVIFLIEVTKHVLYIFYTLHLAGWIYLFIYLFIYLLSVLFSNFSKLVFWLQGPSFDFKDKVSLYTPGWLRLHYLPASTSDLLGFGMCITVHRSCLFF